MATLKNLFACASALVACALLAPLSSNAQDLSTTAPSTTIGTDVDDSVITTKVRAALMADDDIKSIDIKVRTHKGVVMLSGFADSQDQIDRGIAVAMGVEGIQRVENMLSIKEGNQSVGNKIDDTVVTTRVKSALLADPVMSSLDVSVTTRKGEVLLSGFVDNAIQFTHAEKVAKGVEGVSSVVNHMSIKN